MTPIEMTCEICESRMRLSVTLLEKLEGRTGRVKCKSCGNKLSLDGRAGAVVVTAGGLLMESDGRAVSSKFEGSSTASASSRSIPVEANGGDVLLQTAANRCRELEDSLTPHTLANDDESMVRLGREFDSAPYAAPSPRDATYASLFPKPGTSEPSGVENLRSEKQNLAVPEPPRAGELQRSVREKRSPFDETFGLSPMSAPRNIFVSTDGRLLNDSDLAPTSSNRRGEDKPKRRLTPLLFAAGALLALGGALGAREVVPSLRGWATQGDSLLEATAVLDQASTAAISRYDQVSHLSTPTSVYSSDPVATAQAVVRHSPGGTSSTRVRASFAAVNPDPARGFTKSSRHPSSREKSQTEEKTHSAFSAGAASAALRSATALASSCRKPTDPNGKARVLVTFAPSGRVTRATVSGPPYAGTQTGGCIAARFRAARVPAFAGERVTVSKTVTIR